MSRADIEINEDLVSEVMASFGLRSIDEAVDLALRRLAARPGDVAQALEDSREAATGEKPDAPAA